jgi:hypothetical protein
MLSSTQRLDKSSAHLHHGREQLIQTEVSLGLMWVEGIKASRSVCAHLIMNSFSFQNNPPNCTWFLF